MNSMVTSLFSSHLSVIFHSLHSVVPETFAGWGFFCCCMSGCHGACIVFIMNALFLVWFIHPIISIISYMPGLLRLRLSAELSSIYSCYITLLLCKTSIVIWYMYPLICLLFGLLPTRRLASKQQVHYFYCVLLCSWCPEHCLPYHILDKYLLN